MFDINQKIEQGQEEEIDARVDQYEAERVQIFVDRNDAVFLREPTQNGSNQTLKLIKRLSNKPIGYQKSLTVRIPQTIHLMMRDQGFENVSMIRPACTPKYTSKTAVKFPSRPKNLILELNFQSVHFLPSGS